MCATWRAAIAAAHGKRFVRAAERITDGIAPLEADAEAHLDALIARAKELLGDEYSVCARLRA